MRQNLANGSGVLLFLPHSAQFKPYSGRPGEDHDHCWYFYPIQDCAGQLGSGVPESMHLIDQFDPLKLSLYK
jgi:hypothetical protein